MITIKTEEDKTDIHKFLSSQGANIDLTGTIVMTARENGTILALGALSMKDYRVFLDHIVVSGEYVEDLNLVLGLMKSL